MSTRAAAPRIGRPDFPQLARAALQTVNGTRLLRPVQTPALMFVTVHPCTLVVLGTGVSILTSSPSR